MKHLPATLPVRQGGMTLIMALIFLLILTVLGATVATNNSLQTRMAGSTRQRDLALQAAEHSLRTAEAAIYSAASSESLYIQDVIAQDPSAAIVAKPTYVLLNGESHNNDASYWKNTFDWTTNSSNSAIGISSDLTAANPRFVIEQMPKAMCPDDVAKTCFYFRVTARGVGKDAEAAVVLQSMFKFKKP